MLQFVFPHIQDHIFLDKSSYYIDLVSNEVVFSSSIWSWIFYAFVQIAVLEEFMKGTAFKLTSFPRRHKLRKQKDSLLATMFYSGCVAAGFAIFENITYAMHFLPSYGESQTQILMSQRSIFAVLSHMISGLIMGYGFAIGSVKTGIKRLMYPVVGFFGAVMYHGTFDYLLFTADAHETVELIPGYSIHLPTTMIMIMSLAFAFFLGSHLRSYSLRYNKVLRKRTLSTLKRKNSDASQE